LENLKTRDQWEDQDVAGMIILKLSLMELSWDWVRVVQGRET